MPVKRIVLVATALILMALPTFAARRRATTPPGDPCSPGVIAAPYLSAELTIDGAYVYFADDAGGLFRAPKGGGIVSTLVSFTDGETVVLIVVGGDTLYFGTLDITQTVGTIYSVPASGGSPTTLVSGILTLNDLLIDSSNLYWISFGTPNIDFTVFLADARIEKASKACATRTTLASGLSQPIGFALDDTNVYFTETGGGFGSTSAGVRSVPKNGGSVAMVTNGTTSVALAGSGTVLYFLSFNRNALAGPHPGSRKGGGARPTP